TSEIVHDLKYGEDIRNRQSDVIKCNRGADKKAYHDRTFAEAQKSPYSKDAKQDHSGMNDYGKEKLAYYEEVYKQRLKTVGEHSGSNKLNDPNSNRSLAGIESYQFGPKIQTYTAEQFKAMWEQENTEQSLAIWIRNKNYSKLDNACYKEFGFSSPNEFAAWRSENKLTPHETHEGIFLVPNDVHHSERHAGLQTALNQYITGKISKEQFSKVEKDIKIAFIKNECKTRGTRALKGAGMAAIKTFIQSCVKILLAESYTEFKATSKESIYKRIQRILKISIHRLKKDLKNIIHSIFQGAAFSIGMEVLEALNDFFFKTAKNLFRIVRSMAGSIVHALKILFSSNHSWEDKFFEASKIVSAGFVAAIGFSLNEIIEKMITTSFPPLAFAAPFIADVFSGLFASIMSALVLYSFDSYKENIQMNSKLLRKNLLLKNVIAGTSIRTNIASMKTVDHILSTHDFFYEVLNIAAEKRMQIIMHNQEIENSSSIIKDSTKSALGRQHRLMSLLESMDEFDD
ncbi:MAG: hypothetical protein ACRDCN_09240, partial [Tannerellaceae bacterium]